MEYPKEKTTKDSVALVVISLIILFLAVFVVQIKNNEIEKQKQLKNEIVLDNDYLTKQIQLLENENKYLKEQNKQQQESINRLMKLETVDTAKRVVMSEARGGSVLGQVAVFQTMIDRAFLWDLSVKEVIAVPRQYAPPYKGKINDSVNTAFYIAFVDGYRVFQEPTTHFYSGSKPYWADYKINRGSISGNTFMY